MLRTIQTTLMAMFVAASFGGCQTNPATGEKQLMLLSPQQEVQIGQQASQQVTQQLPPVEAAGVQQYVSGIGQKLASLSERPDLPWEFTVLNAGEINAFALPGGKVFINRGLLELMDNEAQLAGVLAHEVGHVTAQHHNDRMVQQMGVQALGAALTIGGEASDRDWLKALGMTTQVGGGLAILKWGREDEHQSDELGLRYMVEAGYNPRGMVQVMEVLRSAAEGAGSPPEWLSTHPAPQSRIDEIEQMVQRRYPDKTVANGYGFFEDRYERNVLQPLRQLPDAPEPVQGEAQ